MGWCKSLWVLAAVMTAGCVERRLTLQTDPPGALVYLNGTEVGRPPLTRDFTFYGNYDVVLRMDGYQTLKTRAKVVPPVYLWPPLDLIAELMPFHVRDQKHFAYTLTPASTQPADPRELAERAKELQKELKSSKYAPTTQPAK